MILQNSRQSSEIREQDPLKQGLKLDEINNLAPSKGQGIREQDPLKQGLKQIHVPADKLPVHEFVSKIH